MGKFGLTGDSGMVADGLHISAPYDSNGMVFVEVEDKEWGVICERVEKEKATTEKMNIITCSMCNKPAVSLDHYWPYYSDHCLCEEHYNDRNKR